MAVKLSGYEIDPYTEKYLIEMQRRDICKECGERGQVHNYDPVWRDGDVICPNGHYVRAYDAG